jgi:hypothetical protein
VGCPPVRGLSNEGKNTLSEASAGRIVTSKTLSIAIESNLLAELVVDVAFMLIKSVAVARSLSTGEMRLPSLTND